MANIVIIEDEAPALKRLIRLLENCRPNYTLIGTADSVESGIELLSFSKPDLIFMDIELADGRSFEIFNQLTIHAPVIFVTAYDEFAIQAFKVNGIDYLLKPIDEFGLASAIEKFEKYYQVPPIDINLEIQKFIQTLTTPSNYKTRFLVKQGTRLISLAIDEIACFMAEDKIVYIKTFKGQKLVIDYSLEELMKQLSPQYFFHVNRQFIVHIKNIESVSTYFNGKLKVVLLSDNQLEVVVSREKAAPFKAWLDE
jgi:two-component system response regulator LytT